MLNRCLKINQSLNSLYAELTSCGAPHPLIIENFSSCLHSSSSPYLFSSHDVDLFIPFGMIEQIDKAFISLGLLRSKRPSRASSCYTYDFSKYIPKMYLNQLSCFRSFS